MELHELVNGVQTFSGNELQLPANSLTVAVHPYIFGIPGREHVYGLPEGSGTVEGIERHMIESSGPIIVLEEAANVDNAARRLLEIGKMEAYFVATQSRNPTPVAGWDSLLAFLHKFGKEVSLIGGFYWNNPNPEERGCLGYTKHVLETNGFNVRMVPEAVMGEKGPA